VTASVLVHFLEDVHHQFLIIVEPAARSGGVPRGGALGCRLTAAGGQCRGDKRYPAQPHPHLLIAPKARKTAMNSGPARMTSSAGKRQLTITADRSEERAVGK